MTDLELLELAAKAAGVEITAIVKEGVPHRFGGGYWNPLTDDGDALRLAVALKIGADCFVDGDRMENCCAWCNHRDVRGFHRHYEPYGNDPMAATRRAIVIVAAEVGKSLP